MIMCPLIINGFGIFYVLNVCARARARTCALSQLSPVLEMLTTSRDVLYM